MPKTDAALAALIDREMMDDGVTFRVYTWPEFSKKADIKRWRAPRYESVVNAFDALGLIIGWGKNCVSVCHDRKTP